MERIREAQRREIIDLDKNISRQAFRKAFEVVQAYKDIYKPPNKMEKTIAYEIEKYLIEMESILTEIQSELSNELANLEQQVTQEAVKSSVVQDPPPNPDVSQQEREEKSEQAEVEGSGRKKGGRVLLTGGVKELRLSLLDVWNRFINYIQKIARVGEFTQNDFNVLYDRLDDLVPLLQNIQTLNRDAETIGKSPIGKSAVDLVLNKIVNKDLSAVIPARDFEEFGATETAKRIFKEVDILKDLVDKVLTTQELKDYASKVNSTLSLISNAKSQAKKARTEESEKYQLERAQKGQETLADLKARYDNTIKVRLTREDIKSRISKLQRSVMKQPERTKFSRRPVSLRGTGKTAVANIINNMGDDIYNLYEAIPEMSYDDLEKLYVKIYEMRKFAQENNDEEKFNKADFLLNRILADPRAKDLQQVTGKGREGNTTLKYGSNQPLYFDDDRNWAYAR